MIGKRPQLCPIVTALNELHTLVRPFILYSSFAQKIRSCNASCLISLAISAIRRQVFSRFRNPIEPWLSASALRLPLREVAAYFRPISPHQSAASSLVSTDQNDITNTLAAARNVYEAVALARARRDACAARPLLTSSAVVGEELCAQRESHTPLN